MGRVEGLTTTHGATTKTLLSNMTYDPFGNPKGMGTGAGAQVDNRTHNRLTQAQGRYGNISYTYDKAGNRQSRTMNTRQEAYSYAPGTNRIQGITGYSPTTFTMDAAGNVTTMGDKTLVYNQRHRLIRVEQGTEVLGEYTYNALEQRVIKEVNGQKTIFLYNHNNRLIAEADENGNIKTEYLYRGKILMAKTDPATGSLYFYLNARLSTPLMMTDESNTLVWEAMYRPFGEASVNPNSTVVNNLRFPGQYYDQETGLHYNYHRYYDPRSGRYLRPDPIGQLGGINIFLYAENNPVNAIDPEGLMVFYWGVGVSAGAGRKPEGRTVNYIAASGVMYQGLRREGGTEKGLTASLGGGRIVGAVAGVGLIAGYHRGDVEDLSSGSTAVGLAIGFINIELTFDESTSWTGFNIGVLKALGLGLYGVESIPIRLPTHTSGYGSCE